MYKVYKDFCKYYLRRDENFATQKMIRLRRSVFDEKTNQILKKWVNFELKVDGKNVIIIIRVGVAIL